MVEKVDGHTVVVDVSIEGTVTTTGANGGKDVVRNDGCDPFPKTTMASLSTPSLIPIMHFTPMPPHKIWKRTRAPPVFPDHRLSSQTQAAPKPTPSLYHPGRRVKSSDTRMMYAGRY